ncbi:FAD/NAD(P)-binding domain-containing protein [Roridomyces roridus]|uniref:FAD/NAD(P)-binding domain-containing protein n=1 Tax=Roridomyces roridus TaxID=1738132 RepID=A0AAD7B8F0_9AGAR|nr:FAD/NAD(P)-binding domain-containing protein [Roridomyces roridus]
MSSPPHSSSSPLQIAIVGAGPGGLAAALALRRSGHHVQIFEASQIKTELGAGIGLQTNALRALRALGFGKGNLRGMDYDGIVVFDAKTGTITPSPLGAQRHGGELRSVACHRSDLHDELKRLAMSPEGTGPPVQLHLGNKIVGCDPESGNLTLANGECIVADLIIGADGINSTIRTSILGSPAKPRPSGFSCFRCLFDASGLARIPELAWLTDGPLSGPRAITWSERSFRMFFIYPVRDGSLINFGAFFEDEPGQENPDGIPIPTTREEMLEKYTDAQPKFLRLLDLPIATPILKWQLRVVPILPTWIRGRAALLGDAAHGTLPLLGQGVAMAIEDAVVLGALLPSGTTREEIPIRLEAYQKLRKERGEFVRTESVEQAAVPTKRGSYARSRELQEMILEYDALKAAQDYLGICIE